MSFDTLSPELVNGIEKAFDLPVTLEDCQTLSQAVAQLLQRPFPGKSLRENAAEADHLHQLLNIVKTHFDGPNNENIAFELHKSLNTIYDYQINSSGAASQYDPLIMEIMLELENTWINFEKSRTPNVDIPQEPKAFARWLKSFVIDHPSSSHAIFKYLANESSFEEMSFFFSQEVTIDPRFDDLIALMQVGIKDPGVKMELASNFWDEMGNGVEEDVHTRLFSHLYKELSIFKAGETFLDVLNRASWQALACGNTLLYSVLHRKNFNTGLGALGTVELISPQRFSLLTKGFKRLGLSDVASQYHVIHISIDARHGNGWLANAITPIVAENAKAAEEIFFGAMLRLNTSMDYCHFMEQKFKL
jgi:hypothetical protein